MTTGFLYPNYTTDDETLTQHIITIRAHSAQIREKITIYLIIMMNSD